MALYDILVIGGGINGLGIAAEAARRGLSVLLLEKGDFGGGTTSASSRLIHGGLRYLQYGEFSLVRESLRERGILVRQRPHLVRPLELLIPDYAGMRPPGWVVGTGLRLYDLLARDPALPRSRGLSLSAVREREPGLAAEALRGGYLYPDAQVEFPERLCVALLRETLAAGGQACNYQRVTGLTVTDGRVVGACYRDELTGDEEEVRAQLVINAAGPWLDVVNALLPTPPPSLIGGTWGTHLVLPLRPEGPQGALYASAKRDGRPFFLLPWDGRLLVGTTDVPFTGDPDQLRGQDWEVEYLLEETNRLFPGAAYRAADVQFTTIGVRPLPAAGSGTRPGAITRRHFLVDHGKQDGVQGLGSVVGGKLTTYRSLAGQVMDWASAQLGKTGRRGPSLGEVFRQPLPSATLLEQEAEDAARGAGMAAGAGRRLLRIFGPHYVEVLQLARQEPSLAQPLVEGCSAIAAEVVHAVRREQARTVDDVLRRRLMLLPPTEALREAVGRVMADVHR